MFDQLLFSNPVGHLQQQFLELFKWFLHCIHDYNYDNSNRNSIFFLFSTVCRSSLQHVVSRLCFFYNSMFSLTKLQIHDKPGMNIFQLKQLFLISFFISMFFFCKATIDCQFALTSSISGLYFRLNSHRFHGLKIRHMER